MPTFLTDLIDNFFYIIPEEGEIVARYNVEELLLCSAGTVLLLASAFWAASIASARRHNAFIHFIFGLILPVLYPLIILLAMTIPNSWMYGEDAPKKDTTRPPEDETAAADDAGTDAPLVFEPTERYFTRISRNEDGTPAGPWECRFAGNTVTVTKILEIFPNCIAVEFTDKRAIPLKMRMLFEKIESFEPAGPARH